MEKENVRFLDKNIKHTKKHGGSSVMVWGCMSSNSIENLFFINGMIDRFIYVNILAENLEDSGKN